MFRSANKVTLDDKGRMVMPTRYREEIAELCQNRLVVTADRDLCLLVYPQPEWEQTESRLMSLPSMDPEARRLQRLMVGYATELEMDSHHRISLPPELREYAKLERLGMLVGQGNRLELWDEGRWRDQFSMKEPSAGGRSPELVALKL
jgi:MraZ protein